MAEQNYGGEILLYQTEDGKTKIDVRLENDTVWLTQAQLCALYQTSKSNISEHIKHTFEEGELDENSVVRKFRTTASDGKSYNITHYSLDMIISLGYRVKSAIATNFRKWATERLKEYMIKGFTMNDDLLKESGGGNYFDELLERIRDIRSSEKVFWRKVLDLYATSIDYSKTASETNLFFQTVQNKMLFASTGETAAELIYHRANADFPAMGMTTVKGKRVTKADSRVAKNYLDEQELRDLNHTVSAFLEIAELRAVRRQPMYMKDWISIVDNYLQMTGSQVLNNAGTISHQLAIEKAGLEYRRYKALHQYDPTPVEEAFLSTLDHAERKILAASNPKPKK